MAAVLLLFFFLNHFSTHRARVILMRDTLKAAQVIVLCNV